MNYIFVEQFGHHDFSTDDLRGKTESTAGSAGEYPYLSTGTGQHELQHRQIG